MLRHVLFVAVVCATVTSMGCGLRRPFERPPGNIDQQRIEASTHDPYADQDAGPEVVGGRPREFSEPRSEPVRSRTHPASSASPRGWFSGWFGG